jgi:hypothetical protein
MRGRHRQSLHLTGLGLVSAFVALSGCGSSNASSSSALGSGVQSLLFIQRQTTVMVDGVPQVYVDDGNGQVLDYERYVPGGSLNLLSPARPDGTVTSLTSMFTTADFNGADVSFDATQAVFSMKRDGYDHYHLYTVQLTTGSDGNFQIHQLTNGDWDDINPIYAPGGLIAFVTNQMYTAMGTRADEYEHQRQALQLATVTIDGGDADRHLFAQNLSHTVAPWLRFDGSIGFSQWEHFGPVNDVKLRRVLPDGSQVLAVAGQHGKPVNSLFTIKEISPNFMLGIGTARDRTIHAGTLLTIDSRNHADPACVNGSAYTSASTGSNACLDEENATFNILTPNVPTGSDPSPVGRYREPSVLPNGGILTSWADGPVNDMCEQSLTPPDFGIYVYNTTTGQNELVYNDRTAWDLNALAVVPRTEPPVVSNLLNIQDSTVPARIGSVDVAITDLNEVVTGAEFNNTPLGTALKEGTVAVRVIEGFSSEAAKGVSMFGLTMFEGAAVLGESPVFPDGSWLANVPPYIPIHLQPIDKYGLAIRNQQLWIQTMPGEQRRCIGCHESRTGQGVPVFQGQTDAEQAAGNPSASIVANFTEAIPNRTEFPWDKKVQPLLNSYCVSCHNSSTTSYYFMSRTDPVTGQIATYKIPTLDLSDTPVTVYYDRMVASWPASYVSIFYPATLNMAGDGDSTGTITLTGTVPPNYGVPGSARASVLTQILNLHGTDGSTAWPSNVAPGGGVAGAFHPENVGVSLTDDERKTIAVYPMDLGGQFWARQNTGFVPFTNGDPVTPNQ